MKTATQVLGLTVGMLFSNVAFAELDGVITDVVQKVNGVLGDEFDGYSGDSPSVTVEADMYSPVPQEFGILVSWWSDDISYQGDNWSQYTVNGQISTHDFVWVPNPVTGNITVTVQLYYLDTGGQWIEQDYWDEIEFQNLYTAPRSEPIDGPLSPASR